MDGRVADRAGRLADLVRAAPARAGETRVLSIDGRSGAGKSTLAARVARELAAPSVSLEQLYGGWDGLQAGIDRLVSAVLVPLAEGRTAQVPRNGWPDAGWLSPEPLAPPAVLVVEGVGAGALAAAPFLSVLAWVELSEDARRARAMARDGALYEGHWEIWSEQEDEYIRRDRPAERADVIIDGSRA